MPLFIILASFFYTLVNAVGLEWHSSYFGNAFQVLHPESFQGDPSMLPTRPSLFSFYYLLVKLFGEVWLDDRFQLVFYFILAILTLIAIDKTVQLMGLKRLDGRLLILSLMLIQHRIMDHHAMILLEGYNPSTLATFIGVWLLYFILAGKESWKIMLLMALAALTAVKYAWCPILFGSIVFWKERCHHRFKIVTVAAVLLFCVSGIVFYYQFLRAPNDTLLFDYIVTQFNNTEGNPFLNTFKSNLLFVLLCIGGLLIHLPFKIVESRVKVSTMLSLSIWFLGGVYCTFAPDSMKIPYLPAFCPTISLWWGQYVLYMAISVFAFKRIEEGSSWKERISYGTILLILYFAPFISLNIKVAIAFFVIAFLLAAFVFLSQREVTPNLYCLLLTVAFVSSTFVFYGVKTFQRLPHLAFLVRNGILGDNPGAKWMGVNEYFRKTPPDVMVLAFSEALYPSWQKKEILAYDSALKIRSGKSMPTGHNLSFLFNYDALMKQLETVQYIEELRRQLVAHNASGIHAKLAKLNYPDYLVMPVSAAAWVDDSVDFGYKPVETINHFAILKKMKTE